MYQVILYFPDFNCRSIRRFLGPVESSTAFLYSVTRFSRSSTASFDCDAWNSYISFSRSRKNVDFYLLGPNWFWIDYWSVYQISCPLKNYFRGLMASQKFSGRSNNRSLILHSNVGNFEIWPIFVDIYCETANSTQQRTSKTSKTPSKLMPAPGLFSLAWLGLSSILWLNNIYGKY